MKERGRLHIGGESVEPGVTRDFRLKVSESYTGDDVTIPLRVIRANRPGPTLFVCAAVHGNEINGTGIIHELMLDGSLELERGSLILAPVVNAFGFEAQKRYMPDRRDLNRCFPGRRRGSLSSRVARVIFDEIIKRCDFGIDIHTAADQRMNLPNVRGDLSDRDVARMAKAFGCELIVNGKGPEGSLRREACAAGCPTILLEAGEPSKIEPGVLHIGSQGIRNVLIELNMLEGEPHTPDYQSRVDRTLWVRAQLGGILRFHVAPGHVVLKGDAIATNASVFGVEQNVLRSPIDAVVLGMTTLPSVKPGEPVCHLAVPRMPIAEIQAAHERASQRSPHHRIRRDLASNIMIADRPTPDGGSRRRAAQRDSRARSRRK